MRRFILAGLLIGVAIVAAAATLPKGHNFSQYQGFKEHFATYPPADVLPSEAERELLRKYRPRFFVPAGNAGPIGFYADYIANGVLKDGAGNVVSDKVSPELLNRYRDDPDVEFVHRPLPTGYKPKPVILGRFSEEAVDLGDGPETFYVLSYHAAFAHSGLPAGLLGWQTLLLGLIGDLDDWHQLDHYTAAYVVLDKTRSPVALILQQHNYHRTYLLGETVALPEDGRVKIDISIRSNELYPHKPGRTNRRAVSFLSRKAWLYMIGAGRRLFLTADDVTQPAHELDYALKFLTPSDAFYTFKGYLGERRLLMGRSGPPGADYKTLPKLLKFDIQLLVGYWRDGNARDIVNLVKVLDKSDYHLSFAEAQGAVFRANLLCVKRWGADCAFQ